MYQNLTFCVFFLNFLSIYGGFLQINYQRENTYLVTSTQTLLLSEIK